MIRVNNNYSISLLFADVHRVVNEASREFDSVEYRFEFDSRNKGVKCVRFWFGSRKPYYINVYPFQVQLFNTLNMLKDTSFGGFTYIRHSVDSYNDNGCRIYSLVLWY